MANAEEFTLQLNAPQVLRIAFWGALGLGVVFFLVGFFRSSNGIGWIAAACFLGIVSRVIQAESHHMAGLSPRR